MRLLRLAPPLLLAATLATILPSQSVVRTATPTTIEASLEDLHEECSIGIAIGKATVDGRPLMWKNRDAKHVDNVIRAFDDGRFPYIGLCNAGASKSVWGGVNAAGFCIMNSLSRDLVGDSETGPGNGPLMKLALMRCETVDEFEELLKETNESGRQTRANFGVIDAKGGAAFFETGHSHYERFDVAENEAGILVRTNFATTAGGDGGRERFARATELCYERPEGHRLDTRFLLQSFCRDLQPPPSAVEGAAGMQDVRETIHRQTTVASMVFHGVRDGEDTRYTTMWAVLGPPLFSVAVPCWPGAGVAKVVSGDPKSPLCDAALSLKADFYEEPLTTGDDEEERPDDVAGDIRWLRSEDVPDLLAKLLPLEDAILDATRDRLEAWRTAEDAPTDREMLIFHRKQAEAAREAVLAMIAEFGMVKAGR